MVLFVDDLDAFNAALKNAGDKLVVVDFTASWCGPCKMIGPVFDDNAWPYVAKVCSQFLKDDGIDLNQVEKKKAKYYHMYLNDALIQVSESLSNEYKDVVFLKVDVDEANDVSSHCDIRSMPTFQFYKKGQKVAEFSGANKDKLIEQINKLK